jgi:hypothetical protein
MIMNRGRGLAFLAVAISILSLGTAVAQGPAPVPTGPPATPAAPAPPFLVLHINLDAWNQGFANSNMARCWNDPMVQQWRSTTLQQFFSQIRTQSGLDIAALGQHMTGEVAFVLSVETAMTPMGPQPRPHGALGIRQPGQIDALLQTINSNLDPMHQQQLQSVTVRQGDVVVFGDNTSTLSNQLAGLMATGGAAQLGLNEPAGSFLSGRLDFAPIYQQMTASGQTSPQEMGVINDLGLGNLQTLQFAAGFQNQGLVADAAVDFSSPRVGLMALLGPNRPSTILSLAPPNTVSACALNIAPPTQILDWIQSMITAQGGPMAAQNFQSGLAQFQQQTGFDLRNQVLASLGQEFGVVIGASAAPPQGAQPGMAAPTSIEAALFAEATDQQTIQQFIAALIQMANRAMAPPQPTQPGQPAPPPPPPMINPITAQAGDVTYQALPLPIPMMPIQLCYGFVGNHLVITTSQSMMNSVAQARGGQNLLQSPGYQAVAGTMAPEAALFGYGDNRQGCTTMLQAMTPLMMMSGAGRNPEVMQLTQQLGALAQYMGQKGSTITVQPTRLVMHSYNTSGAEAIVVAMAVTSAISAKLAQQMPPSQPGMGPQPGMQPAPAGPAPAPGQTQGPPQAY